VPESNRVIPETHADILEKKGFAHVATIGPQGEPHSSPVWYDWDGTHLLISQTTGRQKYRNLQRDARVAVSITDPDNPYRYLEIRGTVVSMDDEGGEALINSLAKKYLDQDVYPWPQPGDHRVVVKVRPEHTSTMG
jgi:PPOX class probable F420-dependent enzyme